MNGITWLHLSDWHQRGPEFDRKVVRDALVRDIRSRKSISADLAKIDFIFVTGDIAFSGRPEEYEAAAENFFKPVLEAAGCNDDGWDRLFMVPGNHDADREIIKRVDSTVKLCVDKPQAVHEVLEEGWQREAVLSAFSGYDGFLRRYVTSSNTWTGKPTYSYSKVVEAAGKKIAIVGLNSAWHCGRNVESNGEFYDYGKLIVGEPQIYERLSELESSGDLVVISLMHHPLNWLVDFDRYLIEDHLSRRCHFILHGHEHMARVYFSRSTIGDVVVIPGGASYDRRQAHDSRYTNSYNFVRLNFDSDEGTVYLRRWSDTRNLWLEDNETYQGGRFHFSIPKNESQTEYQQHARRKLMKRYEEPLSKRFNDDMSLHIRHTVEEFEGIKVVRQQVKHAIQVSAGKAGFTIHETMAGDRIVNLVDQGKLDIKPYEQHYFRVNGKDLNPEEILKNKIVFKIDLEEHATLVEYFYTVYLMTDDVYLLRLGRFTQKFRFNLRRDPALAYDFSSVGGLALPNLKRDDMSDYDETKSNDLCFPDQGYLIRWYPLLH